MYLMHVLAHHHALNLRGIRSSQPIQLSLEDIYVTLTTVNQPAVTSNGDAENGESERLPVRGRPLVVQLNELLPAHTHAS